eukprot:scaffold4098_cov86-Skeletonema_menzelii.AAC.1
MMSNTAAPAPEVAVEARLYLEAIITEVVAALAVEEVVEAGETTTTTTTATIDRKFNQGVPADGASPI